MKPFWRSSKHRWVLPYLDAGGIKRQHIIPPEIAPSKGSRKAALEYAAGWIKSQEESGAVPASRRKDGLTVGEAAPKWLELRREEKRDGKPRFQPSTLGDNASHLSTEILPAFKETAIASLDLQALRRWVRDLAGKHSAQHTRNVYSTFRGLVDSAMGEGWAKLPANPLSHPVVVAALPEARRQGGVRPVHVPLEDAQKLVSAPAVDARRRVRYLVALCSGLSEGELAGRRWSDADLSEERPTLAITGALQTRGADGWATLGPAKNGHRLRTIPLHSAAAAALRWWHRDGWCDYVGRPPKLTEPIFSGPEGNFSRPASAAILRADLRRANCADTCHGQPITAQALRRCFATYLDEQGVHQEQRMRLMGHAPPSVNAKHYTAHQIETDRAAVELIGLTWIEVPPVVPNEVPAAPKACVSAGATLGIRTPDLRFTKTSASCGGEVPTGHGHATRSAICALRPHDAYGTIGSNGTREVPAAGARGAGEVPLGRAVGDLQIPANDVSVLALQGGWALYRAANEGRAGGAA